jgi:hypothetical protein
VFLLRPSCASTHGIFVFMCVHTHTHTHTFAYLYPFGGIKWERLPSYFLRLCHGFEQFYIICFRRYKYCF